ncbi:MAG: HAMP domain-containing histidine kinase [Chitinispirillaceae bacterium]|nr:HAMP domain-containing histidine kinase [Chitinispirillaceae bacterium]
MSYFIKKQRYAGSRFSFLLDAWRLRGSGLFLLVSILCLAAYIFLTQSMLEKLQLYMTNRVELCGERISRIIPDDIHVPEATSAIFSIINNTDIPTIVIDTLGIPVAWAHIAACPRFDAIHTAGGGILQGAYRCVHERARSLRAKGSVCSIRRGGSGIAGYLLMGRSSTIRNLTLLSIAMTVLLSGFVVVMYVSFQRFRLNERSNLWVALAKETAHQLGTPITALMGWVEYLRSTGDPESAKGEQEIIQEIEKICDDMENDLRRLRKISSRFSQIGSVPVLTQCNINEIVEDCMNYFTIRLPLIRRKIEIRPHYGKIPLVFANRDLLEWVIENLLKNSIDAIQKDAGRIEIRTEYRESEKMVRIYHADNGKGIAWEVHKRIFSPGFSTKKRGWGLGLTLAKRIIEDYHQGRIFVHWSKKDKGTVFCVDLPVHAKVEKAKQLNV